MCVLMQNRNGTVVSSDMGNRVYTDRVFVPEVHDIIIIYVMVILEYMHLNT